MTLFESSAIELHPNFSQLTQVLLTKRILIKVCIFGKKVVVMGSYQGGEKQVRLAQHDEMRQEALFCCRDRC